jgi:hypothetical protein
MVARKRSNTHYEEALMSRIATLTAVLTMAVAPAAFAAPADYGSPDVHSAQRAAQTKFYSGQDLRSPDAADVFTKPVAPVDLRSPDARQVFVPGSHVVSVTPASKPEPSDGGFDWGILGLIVAALAACGGLAVMLSRHLDVGRPLGA